MKALILFISLSFFSLLGHSQDYGIINDKDGYVNIRKEANPKSEIIGKLYIKDIFLYDAESSANPKWVKIYKQRSADNLLEGYVAQNRIYPISEYPQLKVKKIGINFCSLKNDSLSVAIHSAQYISKGHKLSINDNGTLIDNKLIWGTDGIMPHIKITSLMVNISNKNIIIPDYAFNDLYEPNYKKLNVYIGTNDIIYIEMNNSDGAGAYTIFWIIKNGKYSGRYIDNIED